MNNDLKMVGLKGFRHIYFVRCKTDFLKSMKYTALLTIVFVIVYGISDKT